MANQTDSFIEWNTLSNKEDQTTKTHNNMDESQPLCWGKDSRQIRVVIQYDSIYMKL